MKWNIQNISIPVYDLKKSIDFYESLLGKLCNKDVEFLNYSYLGKSVFFGNRGVGIRLFELNSHIETNRMIQSNRSFPTIRVENFQEIYYRLIKKKVNFKFFKTETYKNIIFQEPSLNLIHVIESIKENKEHLCKQNPIWKIHHINLESNNVRKSIKFFSDIIGIEEGKWNVPPDMGNFSIDPKDLAILPLSKKNHGIHIIKADHGFAWRNKFIHNPSIGGHPAITVKNIKDITMKLKKRKILFTDAKIYAMPGFHQIYFFDDNSNMIEINQSI